MLLGKAKLGTIEVLISKGLTNSYISHDEFVLVNNVSREYSEMKEEIKNPQSALEYTKTMETYSVSCNKNTANKNSTVRKTKQNRLMLLSNCAASGKKNSRFIKN